MEELTNLSPGPAVEAEIEIERLVLKQETGWGMTDDRQNRFCLCRQIAASTDKNKLKPRAEKSPTNHKPFKLQITEVEAATKILKKIFSSSFV